MRLTSRLRALTAAIPASVNYRPSDNPNRECATCAYDENGTCTMFDAKISPSNVCDEWTPIKSDLSLAASAKLHSGALVAAEKRALAHEEELVAALTPLLEQAGKVAADRFEAAARKTLNDSTIEALVAAHGPVGLRALLAAGDGVNAQSTMIAVKPRPEEAAAIAALDIGLDPSTLHVTLAYLGETEGDLEQVAAALRPVAGAHAPLSGIVGGVGAFGDNGNGYPIILLPSVAGLVELRVDATEALAGAGVDFGRNHGYIPHMTVAYVDGEDADPDEDGDVDGPPGLFEAVGTPLHFDELLIVRGDTEIIPLPLLGAAPVTASGRRATGREIAEAAVWARARGLRLQDWFDEFAASVAAEDTVALIREVAYAHRPEGGYGDTAWNADRGAVFWCSADWSTNDEIEAAEAAFLAIPDVEAFEEDAEVGMEPYTRDGWEVVWRSGDGDPASLSAAAPPPPPGWNQPHPNQIVDVQALIRQLRGVTDPVRQASIEAVMKETLGNVGIEWDVTNPFTAKVLARAGSQVTEIADTTQLNVMRIIKESYEAGLSIPSTAKAIQGGMAEAAPDRARLIARTELSGAVNGGSLAAVQIVEKKTGSAYVKVWLTADGAKYPRHEDYDGLDGQAVSLSAYFDVGGFNLQHPGDPNGPPEEICNCRCTMAYESPDDDEGDGGDEGDEEDSGDNEE